MNKGIGRQSKKLLALLLAAVMTLGLLPGQMQKVEAATEVELSVVSVHDQGFRYLIYLQANGYDIAQDVYWNNNTYYLDGRKIETNTAAGESLNYAIDAKADRLLLCIQYGAIESGAATAGSVGLHTLLIPKGTVFGTGTAGEFVLANDLAFTIKGSEITQVQATSLRLKSAAANDGLTRYHITLSETADTTADIYWNNNTVYVDGAAKSGDGVNYLNGDDLTLLLDYKMVEPGKTGCGQIGSHTLTIPCGTLIGIYNNTKAVVTTNKLELSVNGGAVTEILPKEEVTLSDRPSDGSTVGGGFYFVVDPADSYPVPNDGTGGWSTYISFASGGISIDGTSCTEIKLKKIASNMYYVPLGDFGKTVSANQIVTVDGSIKSSDVEVVFAPTQFVFTGTGWDVYTPPEKTTLTITGTDGGGYQDFASRWLIWLDSTETVPAANTFIGGLQIEVKAKGDSPVSYALGNGELLVLDNNGTLQWALLLPTSSYGELPAASAMDADTEYRVTIKAGTGFSSADDNEVEIPEDVTILFREQALQGILTYENAALLQRPTDNASGTSGIYFVTEENDGLAYAGDWNTRPNIVAGNVTVDGTKITTTARSLVKITDTLYYFSFASGDTANVPAIKVGSKVTFDFLAYNAGETGKIVKFAKTTFVLGSDNVWTVYVPSVIRGDANGDRCLDVRDIVRLKWYLRNNDSVTIDSDGADANGDSVINARDLIKLYEYLLEGTVANAGTAEAAYVMGDMPVYLDDIEIPLAAYQGPRAGGFTNYTYVPDADGYIYKKNILGTKTPSGTLGVETVAASFINAYEMQQYREAGFTTLVTESDCSWTKHDIFGLGGGMYANLKYYMLLAQDAGLDVIVTSSAVNAFLEDMKHSEYGVTQKADSTDVEITKTLITEDLTALVDFMNGNNAVTQWQIDDTYLSDNYPPKYHERMKKSIVFDNFAGIQLSDEVDYLTCKDKYNYVAVEMKKIKPDCRFLSSNLLNGNRKPSETNRNTSLAEVLNGFAAQTKQFTYDKYPFEQKSVITGTTNNCTRGANTVLTTWFSSLSDVAKAAKANGVSAGITLQSFGMDNAADGTIKRAPKTQAEMSWQVYTALAYGMKEINYFTYWEHRTQALNGERHTGSMVRYPDAGEDLTKSVKTELYTFVQTINKEIRKYDHVFMDFDWQESQVLGSNGSFEYIADTAAVSDRASFTNSTGTALVSAMKDNEKGVDGFWIVNAEDPGAGTASVDVTVSFKDARKALVYVDGEKTSVSLSNGSYTVSIPHGKGVFVIPY